MEVREWDKSFQTTLYWACDYSSIPGLKSILVSKGGPRFHFEQLFYLSIVHRTLEQSCDWSGVNEVILNDMGNLVANKLQPVNIFHYDDVIMNEIASQITSLTIVYSTVHSGADRSKYQSSASLALCGKFTGDRWISRTNGQYRGKYFHLMTSSCHVVCCIILVIITVFLYSRDTPSKKSRLFFTTIFTQFSSNAHPVLI